MSIVPEPLD